MQGRRHHALDATTADWFTIGALFIDTLNASRLAFGVRLGAGQESKRAYAR